MVLILIRPSATKLLHDFLLDHLVRLNELLLTFELGDAVFERFIRLLTLVDLLLVVRLARVEERVLEKLHHAIQLLIDSVERPINVQL